MKVVFVHSRMPGGGIERVTLTLIKNLQERGVDCCLALRRASGDLIQDARAITEVVELASSGIQEFIPSLTRLIEEFAPTHLVTAVPDVTILTLIARRRAASKALIVQGAHNAQARVAYKKGPGGYLKYVAYRFLAYLAYRYVDAVVAVSQGIRNEIVEEFNAASQRVKLIHNPIIQKEDISEASFPTSPLSSSTRFVAIGRLSHEKGFDVLLRALESIDGHWQLSIYGDGPEHDNLARLIDTCGLKARVALCGYTKDPYTAIDACDWLVVPSRAEGFGLVLVEALARGVPVIASDCPHGPREILDDGRFGLLVQPDDANALAAVIRQVIDRRFHFERDELKQRAMDYSVSQSVDRWYELLRQAAQPAKLLS